MSNRSRCVARLLGVSFLFAACAVSARADGGSSPRRVFELGNSLTADAVIYGGGIDGFAAARARPAVQGRSIRWGMGLKTQWDDYLTSTQSTSSTTLNGFGFFQQAFANNTWDAIVLQPFANSLADEMDAAKHIIDIARASPANHDAALYLYAPWPGLEFGTGALTFDTRWQQPYDGSAVGNFPSRSFFRACFERLKADFPENDVYFIPAGEVFEALARRITNGELAGLTDPRVLYADGLHASDPIGRYAASVSYYAGVMGEDPRGLPVPAAYAEAISPVLADAIQATVWHVFTSQALSTGLWAAGDITGDGHVVFDDLLVLAQHYQQAAPTSDGWTRVDGDLTADGLVNFDDLLLLAQHYGSTNTPALPGAIAADWMLARTMIPEPMLASALIAASAVGRRRRPAPSANE